MAQSPTWSLFPRWEDSNKEWWALSHERFQHDAQLVAAR